MAPLSIGGGWSSCPLLGGEYSATAGAQPHTTSPDMGEPLLVRAAIDLGPYWHPAPLDRTLAICLDASEKKTRTQTTSPFPEGTSPQLVQQLLRRSLSATAQPRRSLLLPQAVVIPCTAALPPPACRDTLRFQLQLQFLLLPLACCPG